MSLRPAEERAEARMAESVSGGKESCTRETGETKDQVCQGGGLELGGAGAVGEKWGGLLASLVL